MKWRTVYKVVVTSSNWGNTSEATAFQDKRIWEFYVTSSLWIWTVPMLLVEQNKKKLTYRAYCTKSDKENIFERTTGRRHVDLRIWWLEVLTSYDIWSFEGWLQAEKEGEKCDLIINIESHDCHIIRVWQVQPLLFFHPFLGRQICT